MSVHSTAIVDRHAEIDPTAEIGPYAIIDGPVHVGPGTRVYPHAYLTGWTRIGARCQIHPHAVVGHLPQDFAYDGAETYCVVGDETVVREGASIHRGTAAGSSTVVGQRCFIMANAHVAHNCAVGDEVKIVNDVLLAGHVHVGTGAFLSGGAVVHQFVRIGDLAMLAGTARVTMDVPPFFTVGPDGRCVGVNSVGLRRAGFSPAERKEIGEAFHLLYRSGHLFTKAIELLAERVTTGRGSQLVAFLREPSRRGTCAGRRPRDAMNEATAP